MLFLQLLWVLTFSTTKFTKFFFFCQGCILQRGHDHTNVPMPVKGYDVGSTSYFNDNNNNAGLQYFIVKEKWLVTVEFVVLFSYCAFFNNGVKMIVPMPDVGLCCRLMHVVIQMAFCLRTPKWEFRNFQN
jgi:hypothetical protein